MIKDIFKIGDLIKVSTYHDSNNERIYFLLGTYKLIDKEYYYFLDLKDGNKYYYSGSSLTESDIVGRAHYE